MAQGTRGLDDLLVFYSKDVDDEFHQERYGDNILRIVSNYSLDLWVRDFGLVGPAKQVKFTYLPKYLKPENAKFSDGQFNNFLKSLGIKVTHSDIVLDGGNVVDNNWDKAIISERILDENKGKTKNELKIALENLLNMTIAFIPDPGDTTGHADGIVSFIEDDVVLIADYNGPDYYSDVERSIKTAFPGVQTVRLECKDCAATRTSDKNSRGFVSATGYVENMVMTDNGLYIPSFKDNAGYNKEVLDLVKASTSKTVVEFVDTSELSLMGGSVRSMTFQIAYPSILYEYYKRLQAELSRK